VILLLNTQVDLLPSNSASKSAIFRESDLICEGTSSSGTDKLTREWDSSWIMFKELSSCVDCRMFDPSAEVSVILDAEGELDSRDEWCSEYEWCSNDELLSKDKLVSREELAASTDELEAADKLEAADELGSADKLEAADELDAADALKLELEVALELDTSLSDEWPGTKDSAVESY